MGTDDIRLPENLKKPTGEAALAQARGSAEFLYCKECIHSCAQMQVPTYHPDAWCYMFRESQRDSINAQGYCGQKRPNPIVPPIPPNDEVSDRRRTT